MAPAGCLILGQSVNITACKKASQTICQTNMELSNGSAETKSVISGEGHIRIMENKMDITRMGLYRVLGLGNRLGVWGSVYGFNTEYRGVTLFQVPYSFGGLRQEPPQGGPCERHLEIRHQHFDAPSLES